MKKQGFTLIELMVVIVIMGILAAVAVPKLFGMIAKSKASEVGPAAGTYIKLQDAYVSESNKVGSWKLIGYVAPGSTSAASEGSTTNFAYTAGTDLASNGSTLDIDGSSGVGTAGKVTWQAKNRVALNECAVIEANKWTLTTKAASNGNSVTYTAAVTDACLQLTPTFEKIGQ